MVVNGIYYAAALSAVGITLAWLLQRHYVAYPFLILAAFCLYFFRDPEREIPQGAHAVSPADGKVVAVKPDGPNRTRISIFLNVFDVHVNRAPIAGQVTGVKYKPGEFLVASREEATLRNEMNTLTVRGDDGVEITFSQIAGLVARRIICHKKVGDRVEMGERFGHIQFGSRMDILFGPEWEMAVAEGQRVSAGSTILARRK